MQTQPKLTLDFVPFPERALEGSVVDRFEEQVEMHRERLALKVGDAGLSYGELNARANRIAHALLGVCGEQPVPVVLLSDDTTALVAAIVGVLKSGNFYVILDPTDPPSRLRALFADTQADVVVCTGSTRALVSELDPSARTLDLDEVLRRDDLPTRNPGRSIAPDALMNIMYTSGSTGRPKGVLQTHRNLLHTTLGTTNRLRHSADERMALFSPLGVGVGAAMLFGGLLLGAAVLPFNPRREGVGRIFRWLLDERITATYSLPSVMRNALLLAPAGQRLPDLRSVKMGGEPLFRSDLQLFREHFEPGTQVQLTLGTTETYVISYARIDFSTEPSTPVLPVGGAEDDAQVVLIDDQGREVEAGEVGQIVLRSDYLSPGYWRQPEATAAAFKVGPSGQREYHSGDLGRVLPDGKLQHLGRKDAVAKIRGHLVSPTEVETAVRELPTVSDAAVVIATQAERSRLIAYVVEKPGGERDARRVREELSRNLPVYMVPLEYVFLDRLPKLPNGKVDTLRLPSPEQASAAAREATYVAPRTPVEAAVAGIWSEVLGQPRVGVEDNFADLGGDSLQAARVLARVNAECGVELPFSTLFDAPTVAAVARIVGQQLTSATDDSDLAALLDEIENLPDGTAEHDLQSLS
jgi:amino acid adenylation domain-containing protein